MFESLFRQSRALSLLAAVSLLGGSMTGCAGSQAQAEGPQDSKVKSSASAVAETATEFAHDVKDLAVEVGHGARDVAVDIADGTKAGVAKANARADAKAEAD